MNIIIAVFVTLIFLLIGLSITIPLFKKHPEIMVKIINTSNVLKNHYIAFCNFNIRQERVWKLILFLVTILCSYKFISMPFEGLYVSIVNPDEKMDYFSFIFSYAWFSYFIMGIFWLFEIKLGKFFPITGTIAGVVGVLFASIVIIPLLFLMPAIILAYIFCQFHFSNHYISLSKKNE